MPSKTSFLLVLVNLLTVSVDSFTICRPSSCLAQTPSLSFHPSTCLRAEEEKSETETEAEAETSDEESAPAGDAAAAATDILNSPAFLQRKLEVLKSDIEKVEQEIEDANKLVEEGKAEWGPQLDSLKTEFQNIQQRMTSQNKEGDDMAVQQVVREMLDLLDNFDRAFGVITPETDEEKKIEAEYKEVYQMLLDTFEKLGVKQVETVGTEFDYEIHQAVMQRPSDEYDEGIVCDELQKGFIVGDKLIRAAMVAVAA